MTNEEAREQIENLRAHCSDMMRSTFTGGEVLWAKDVEALDQAIKALAQEPCEDAISRQTVLDVVSNPLNIRLEEIIEKLPSVNPQEPKIDTLDKIRAEIERTVKEEQKYDKKWAKGLLYAVKIIDKYKSESEE